MFSAAAMKHDSLAFGVIEPARQQICVDHHVRLDDFAPIVTDNPFVPPRHVHIYARGLFAGLTGDWIAAGHILAPQIENSIRYVLMQAGAIAKSLSPQGIQADILLDSLLRKPELTQILGVDIVFDLRGLLVEKSGSNLRHLLAHGLMDQWDLISMRVRYLWWLALRALLPAQGESSVPGSRARTGSSRTCWQRAADAEGRMIGIGVSDDEGPGLALPEVLVGQGWLPAARGKRTKCTILSSPRSRCKRTLTSI
jgi:hypothetical protein